MDFALTPFLHTAVGLRTALPIPNGLKLIRPPDDKQTQLVAEPYFARKMRRAFGYVSEIVLTSGEGADTPAHLQVVCKIPWKYGSTADASSPSWILARLQAFASDALFPRKSQIVKLGSCIVGYCEPTSGDFASCQLVGRGACSPLDWAQLSPMTIPPSYDLNIAAFGSLYPAFTPFRSTWPKIISEAVFAAPQLIGQNFTYTRLPHVSHAIFSSPPIGGAYAVPAEVPHVLAHQLRAQHMAQSALYGGPPTAVAHIPPPPGRGRSAARAASNVRNAPPSHPVPRPFVGNPMFGRFPPISIPPPPEHHSHPEGRAASGALAANRAARIRYERANRPAPSLLEQQAARSERVERRRQLEIDEFMSAPSVMSGPEIYNRHL